MPVFNDIFKLLMATVSMFGKNQLFNIISNDTFYINKNDTNGFLIKVLNKFEFPNNSISYNNLSRFIRENTYINFQNDDTSIITIQENIIDVFFGNNTILCHEQFINNVTKYYNEVLNLKASIQEKIKADLMDSLFKQKLGVTIIIIAAILFVVTLSILYVKYAKKQQKEEFKWKDYYDNFALKKYCYILFIILFNCSLGVLIYFYGGILALFIVIIIFKAKDILLTVLQTIYYIATFRIYPFHSNIITENIASGNIVSIIPMYSETKEQVEGTIFSIIDKNKCINCKNLLCIISDGKKSNLIETFTQILLQYDINYISWKNDENILSVTYGYINETPCLFLNKKNNMGKRDSLIIGYDIFNIPRNNIPDKNILLRNNIRDNISTLFDIRDFKYMFCTDADSIITENSFNFLIETLEKRNSIACCGLVVTDFSEGQWNFWTILQNFQYLFGQYVRRNAESLYGKVTCLPGCITMFKVHSIANQAIEMYSELPHKNDLLKTIVQLLGTDRRLTNSFLFQNIDVYTVFDSRAKCLTIPPNNCYPYITQRRRWGSNSYFNTLYIIFGKNIYLITRFIALLDYLRMSLVYFRIFNTIMFIFRLVTNIHYQIKYHEIHCSIQNKIHDIDNRYIVDDICSNISYNILRETLINLAPCIAVLMYPLLFFFTIVIFDNFLRKLGFKLIIGYFYNKLVGSILSLVVITNVYWNIGSTKWGANQTYTPSQQVETQPPVETPPVETQLQVEIQEDIIHTNEIIERDNQPRVLLPTNVTINIEEFLTESNIHSNSNSPIHRYKSSATTRRNSSENYIPINIEGHQHVLTRFSNVYHENIE